MPLAWSADAVAADVRTRFIRYARIDTQSDPDSSTYPSTAKQLDLLQLLVQDLRDAGVADAIMDDHGYVMGTITSTMPAGSPEPPVIGFLAHIDTSPELSGANMRPRVTRYDGRPIVLTGQPAVSIVPDDNPDLAACLGHDIITSDGTTLLGADDKAGVAEVVSAAAWLIAHPFPLKNASCTRR